MFNIHKIEGKLDQLIDLLQKTELHEQKSLLSIDEAASYLGITTSTLYKHTSAGNIAHFKPNGKLILFKKEDLNAWVDARRIPANSEFLSENELKSIVSPSKKAI